jgi:hypothetical protein
VPRAVIVWTADGEGLAILPPKQDPAASLLQLREEIARRQEDAQRAADFQATVKAGHVEDVDTWHAPHQPGGEVTTSTARARDTPGRAPVTQQIDGCWSPTPRTFALATSATAPAAPSAAKDRSSGPDAVQAFVAEIKGQHLAAYHGEKP